MEKLPAPDLERLRKSAGAFARVRSPMWRVHSIEGLHPSAWNELRRWGPHARCWFDPQQPPPSVQEEGVMYLADDVPTCLAEAFQDDRIINRRGGAPFLSGFEPTRTLDLLDLTDGWPLQVGGSNAINATVACILRALGKPGPHPDPQ